MKILIALIFSAVALTLYSACSLISSPSVEEGPDGMKILVAGSGEGGMDAQLVGDVALVKGDCLGVNADGTEFLVAWKSGSVDTSESGPVIDVGGTEYRLGDEVILTGGAVSPGSNLIPTVPDECSVDEVFVVNE